MRSCTFFVNTISPNAYKAFEFEALSAHMLIKMNSQERGVQPFLTQDLLFKWPASQDISIQCQCRKRTHKLESNSP